MIKLEFQFDTPNRGRKESAGRRQGFGGSVAMNGDGRDRSASLEAGQRPTPPRKESTASHRSRTSSRINYDDPVFQGYENNIACFKLNSPLYWAEFS